MIDLILIILAILLPPLPVAIRKSLGVEFLLSVVLTLFGYLPGLIYAVFVILSETKNSGAQ